MAKLYDLARMTTATTGTGTITLGSAYAGFLSFSGAGVQDGDVIDYAINDPGTSPTASEIGTGTYIASGTTLTRSVTKSTNGNAAINLSGNAHVLICPRAETLNDASLFTGGTVTRPIQGTTTNDNAPAGDVGEYISSNILVGSSVPVTSNMATDITSVLLTAGDWDCRGNIATHPDVTTVTQSFYGWISTASATIPTAPNGGVEGGFPFTASAGSGIICPVGTGRFSLPSSTNVYLSTYMLFTISTMGAYGFLGCRRVR